MGKYVIFAEFGGDDEYTPKRSRSLFLSGVNPHLNIVVNTINVLQYEESNTITGIIKDNKNQIVAGATVKIKVITPNNDITTLTAYTNSNGLFTASYTPTERGGYTIYAETDETEEFSKSTSNEQLIFTNSLNTTTLLSSDVETIIIGNTVSLTATVKESTNTVQGVTVSFYEGNNLLGTGVTNTQGQCVFKTDVTTVKNYIYHAVAESNTSYNTSTSSNITVQAMNHTLTVELYETSIYTGWNPRISVIDETGEGVSGLSFSVTINGTTTNFVTDSGGILELPVINATGTTNISISLAGATGYNNITKNFTVTVKDAVNITNSKLTVANNATKIPYKSWEQLENAKVAGDGNYIVCGKNCYSNMLGGKNGSWNTPAPLKFSNFGFNIPDNAVLNSLKVTLRIRTLSCSSDVANIKITNPTLKMFNNSVIMTLPSNSDGKLPYKNFGDVTGEISLSNVTVSQLNNNDSYFIIEFPRNMNTNTGKLQIDYAEIKIKYTPQREG